MTKRGGTKMELNLQFHDAGGDVYGFREEREGKVVAEITWTMLGDVMVMDHTFVDESLRGGGVAKQLLDRAATYAREKGYRMEPVCSYVIMAFERYADEYNDVKCTL